MMVPKNFEQDFGEENDMPSDMQEKTPGVYVRADDNELPHELDMLWSNSRSYHREERSPLISFIAGLMVGIVLTSAVFLLIVMRPQVKTSENEMTKPVAEEINGNSTQPANASTSNQGASSALPVTQAQAGQTTYTVVNGDNLGRIAGKVYGSSDPKYIDKIQRANHMSSPDQLQIDQKLVIPPKDY
jgi:LysM repeat protein